MRRRSPAHWTVRHWKLVPPTEDEPDPFPGCFCPCHKRRNKPKIGLVHSS